MAIHSPKALNAPKALKAPKAPTESYYVGVVSGTVTRYAPLSEFMAALSTLNASFTSVKTPSGSLVHGPSLAQFAHVGSLLAVNHNATVKVLQAMDDMEARVTAIENKRKPKILEFDDEFSPDFD